MHLITDAVSITFFPTRARHIPHSLLFFPSFFAFGISDAPVILKERMIGWLAHRQPATQVRNEDGRGRGSILWMAG